MAGERCEFYRFSFRNGLKRTDGGESFATAFPPIGSDDPSRSPSGLISGVAMSPRGAWTLCALACLSAQGSALSPSVMHSVALQWNFDDGLDGWARSTAMEMGMEVGAIDGYLRGVLLPSIKMHRAFIDSPELRVDIDPDERDHLIVRMKYLGQCERAMIALERSPQEGSASPGVNNDGRVLHNPVTIPFSPKASSLEDELYVFPIWQHVTGSIHCVRVYPCTKIPVAAVGGNTIPRSGQTIHVDWVAFAKAPVITKVRGCIDRYFSSKSASATMNCSETPRFTNTFLRDAAFNCGSTDLPFASTYNCLREGGQRIHISGKHFGSSDAIVTVGGLECLDVVHTVPEVELQCTLPPVSLQWLASPTYPSNVRVRNGRLNELYDEVPFLSYVSPVRALPAPTISNVAAHAIDVNWTPSPNWWEAMTITGYRVDWKRCDDLDFNPYDFIVVGNITSTTLTQLLSRTGYHARVTALTEDYRARDDWQAIDLYGRRPMLQNAVVGEASSLSLCSVTLDVDFAFTRFSAGSLTNVSASLIPRTPPTLGPTGEIGDQGHFGLYVNGDANVENCNATASCCDGFDASNQNASANCTFSCSVTENRVSTFVNGRTTRTIPTNAPGALPSPAKQIQSLINTRAVISSAPFTAPCGPALRLSASASFLTGSAWYPRRMNIREGFDTTFVFRTSNPSTFCGSMDDVHTRCRSRGGDGFAFVIQNDNEISLGSGGMELGYGGIKNAIAVEFDTWYNYEQLDAYENHISVNVGRKGDAVYANHTFSLGSTSNLPDLTNGAHTVRVVYDPNIEEDLLFGEYFSASTLAGSFFDGGEWASGVGIISVFVDDLESPVLAVTLRVENVMELYHGRAWVGFTASTGATAYQTQDILSWSFESLRRNIVRVPVFTTVVM